MTVRILQGHVVDVLASLPAKSVHTVCTSPPYWGLRAYQTPPQVWDGAEGCEHEWGPAIVDHKRGADAGPSAQVSNTVARVCPPTTQQGAFCQRCGSWRGELGSEPTLDLFVTHLVDVMAAVGRVLRDDGTLWVNLGDSYASNGGPEPAQTKWQVDGASATQNHGQSRRVSGGLKPGDLCMAPARFALAMQKAGWTLRSQIVLPKKAPMPESLQSTRWERCRVRVAGQEPRGAQVGAINGQQEGGKSPHITDLKAAEWADCPGCPKCSENEGYVQRWGSWRPTSAYEVLYLFSKAGQRYYADGEAVRMPVSAATLADGRTARGQRGTKGEYGTVDGNAGYNPAGRNLWNYVMWAPEPLQAAHYASFPRFIPRLAIQAGTSEAGVCPACGAPWLRCLGEKQADNRGYPNGPGGNKHRTNPDRNESRAPGTLAEVARWTTTTLGWRQSCSCAPHQPSPATVLDPFSGSGTTLIEANALGRHGIGVELQEKYVAIAHKRLSGQPLSLFAHEGATEFAGGAEVDAPETTKQEQHPNRTVLGLPPLVKARDGAVGVAPEAAG